MIVYSESNQSVSTWNEWSTQHQDDLNIWVKFLSTDKIKFEDVVFHSLKPTSHDGGGFSAEWGISSCFFPLKK